MQYLKYTANRSTLFSISSSIYGLILLNCITLALCLFSSFLFSVRASIFQFVAIDCSGRSARVRPAVLSHIINAESNCSHSLQAKLCVFERVVHLWVCLQLYHTQYIHNSVIYWHISELKYLKCIIFVVKKYIIVFVMLGESTYFLLILLPTL